DVQIVTKSFSNQRFVEFRRLQREVCGLSIRIAAARPHRFSAERENKEDFAQGDLERRKVRRREMKSLPRSMSILAVAFILASCGEPERAKPTRGWAPVGTGDFDEVGKISLFQGESCASQIMFVFHGAR